MVANTVRILVVDDFELVRRTLCERLAREPGFLVVDSAGSVDEARTKALAHAPDVILMDIDLNRVESLPLTLELSAALPATRILMLSALFHDRYIDFVLQHNLAGYVSKQSALDKLLEAVKVVANGGQYYSRDVRERLIEERAGALRTPLAALTPRQREILVHIANGRSKKDVATELRVSVKTVETHCEMMMKKLGLHDRVNLTRYAIREGLLPV